ncbi:unnamed protein product [Trichobilharzia regenti]|nr:unnamed protein product [Trichobilharzia regenti]
MLITDEEDLKPFQYRRQNPANLSSQLSPAAESTLDSNREWNGYAEGTHSDHLARCRFMFSYSCWFPVWLDKHVDSVRLISKYAYHFERPNSWPTLVFLTIPCLSLYKLTNHGASNIIITIV